ncbi:hypothetical protein FB451DRAFT_377659 [Mycena latifolia]|nr:hypothetical protein FB451DRAFT_377659 [Mycena latifolia]
MSPGFTFYAQFGDDDPAEEMHGRLVALRQLTSRGIPCILWGEDALCYAHNVPTVLFDQQILVPDELLESAGAVLQEGRYVPAPPAWDYVENSGPRKGESPWPRSIRLQHLDIPEDDPYKLEPLPCHILLLPQLYFGLDVRSAERFQSFVPFLDASNADILVPKYHTFLEGLVTYLIDPPTGLEVLHRTGRMNMMTFFDYLLDYRCCDRELRPKEGLRSIECAILDELQMEEARWFMKIWFTERRAVRKGEILEYQQKKSLKKALILSESQVFKGNNLLAFPPPSLPLHPRTPLTFLTFHTASRARTFSTAARLHSARWTVILAASRRLVRLLR